MLSALLKLFSSLFTVKSTKLLNVTYLRRTSRRKSPAPPRVALPLLFLSLELLLWYCSCAPLCCLRPVRTSFGSSDYLIQKLNVYHSHRGLWNAAQIVWLWSKPYIHFCLNEQPFWLNIEASFRSNGEEAELSLLVQTLHSRNHITDLFPFTNIAKHCIKVKLNLNITEFRGEKIWFVKATFDIVRNTLIVWLKSRPSLMFFFFLNFSVS